MNPQTQPARPAAIAREKKTRIVCTVGPACNTPEKLRLLADAGMNVARINFAHADLEAHAAMAAMIRQVARETGHHIAILGDLPGPRIRIGTLTTESIELEAGQPFTLTPGDAPGDATGVSVSFPPLADVVRPGGRIYLCDGFIHLEVESVEKPHVRCKVVVGGVVRPKKGVNIPDVDLGVSAFTERDRKFLEFAVEQRFDAVSQSFVESASDLEQVRALAASLGYVPMVIAKIERSRAVENLDALLLASDGIMVARGDLGVETPIERIGITQKMIIRRAKLLNRPVITATHMLESMVRSSRPTRAEATDVANAILDGTDAVMLSEETAAGLHPHLAARMMADIALATESSIGIEMYRMIRDSGDSSHPHTVADRIALSIAKTAYFMEPAALFTPTAEGFMPRNLSRFRLPFPIHAVSASDEVCRRLQFCYGIEADHQPHHEGCWSEYARQRIASAGLEGTIALVAHGIAATDGDSHRVEIVELLPGLSRSQSIW